MDRTARTLVLPIDPHNVATLFVAAPLTEVEWTRLLIVLNAMKPGLVADDPGACDEAGVLLREPPPAIDAEAVWQAGARLEARAIRVVSDLSLTNARGNKDRLVASRVEVRTLLGLAPEE